MSLKQFVCSFTNFNFIFNENLKVPLFVLKAENVSLIKSPKDFYERLKILSSKSKKRISISSLYIGKAHLENELISSFSQTKSCNPNLEITILLDYNRATREWNPPESNLIPLVNQGASINFYLTHTLSSWHKYFFRKQRFNELISLHHMKLYIFDDDIIISGANLSDLYFTNRQDRYILIENSPMICNYFDQLIKTISKFSLLLQPNGNFILNDKWEYDPRLSKHQKQFKISAQKEIEALNANFHALTMKDNVSSDTIAFPLLQMNTIGIQDEEYFTSGLIKQHTQDSSFDLATGYFNLTDKYQKDLADSTQKNSINILMASEEANGFFNGKGFLKYIPLVYTCYVRKFLKSINQKSNIQIRYYNKKNWSFHAKGIWLSSRNFFLTISGSTNFGYRSVIRDNEAQIVLITKNDQLKKSFEQEYQHLMDSSKIICKDNDLPKTPFWVILFARVFRSFF